MKMAGETRQHAHKTRLRFVDQYAALEDLTDPSPSPFGDIRISVTARMDDGIFVAFKPPHELIMTRNSMGDYIWHGRKRVPNGKPQAWPLDEGSQYVLRIDDDRAEYGRVEITRIGPNLEPADLNQLDVTPPVELPPGPAYRFKGLDPLLHPQTDSRRGQGPTLLRGAVFHSDGRPYEGVRVSCQVTVAGNSRATIYPLTDATGAWLLALTGRFGKPVDESFATLRFDLPDGESITVNQVPVVSGRQTTHTQTALRGRIFDAKGIGKKRVRITLDSDPDLQTATNSDGNWSLHFPLDRHVSSRLDTTLTAVAADGQTQTQDVQIEPRRIVTIPEIHFEEP